MGGDVDPRVGVLEIVDEPCELDPGYLRELLPDGVLHLLTVGFSDIAAVNDLGNRTDGNAGLSVAGWLAVLLSFVLARVFAEGAQMRDELEGTV